MGGELAVSRVYEALAVLLLVIAGLVAFAAGQPQSATWASGASIACGTLALVCEHRRR